MGIDGIGAVACQTFADVDTGTQGVHQGVRPFVKVVEGAGDMGHGGEEGAAVSPSAQVWSDGGGLVSAGSSAAGVTVRGGWPADG